MVNYRPFAADTKPGLHRSPVIGIYVAHMATPPSGPRTPLEMIDLDDPSGRKAQTARSRPTIAATLGLVLEDRGSGIVGALVEFF